MFREKNKHLLLLTIFFLLSFGLNSPIAAENNKFVTVTGEIIHNLDDDLRTFLFRTESGELYRLSGPHVIELSVFHRGKLSGWIYSEPTPYNDNGDIYVTDYSLYPDDDNWVSIIGFLCQTELGLVLLGDNQKNFLVKKWHYVNDELVYTRIKEFEGEFDIDKNFVIVTKDALLYKYRYRWTKEELSNFHGLRVALTGRRKKIGNGFYEIEVRDYFIFQDEVKGERKEYPEAIGAKILEGQLFIHDSPLFKSSIDNRISRLTGPLVSQIKKIPQIPIKITGLLLPTEDFSPQKVYVADYSIIAKNHFIGTIRQSKNNLIFVTDNQEIYKISNIAFIDGIDKLVNKKVYVAGEILQEKSDMVRINKIIGLNE